MRMKLIGLILVSGSLIFTVSPSRSFAEGNPARSIGAIVGVSTLNNGGGSPVTYGVLFDYEVMPAWSLGFQFNSLAPSVSVAGVSYSQTLSNFDLALKYSIDSLKFGVLLGMQSYTSSVPGATNSSNFSYGLVGSYDWLLSPNFSLGPQVEGIWTSQSGGYTEVDFLASFKYWF